MTSKAQVKALMKLISQTRNEALFACGGAIPIGSDKNHCAPVQIRFDSSNPTISSVTFPSNDSDALDQLLHDSQPATFGHGGSDVYDENYRKAAKMDTTAFSTNFNPHDLGIVDTIGQLLHPSLHANTKYGYRGVRAEIYKLNIYSGPSGMFKLHVDTPRDGPDHFGSLVICLPCVHEGGGLIVRSGDMSVNYDWSSNPTSRPFLHWAAFYSDCPHEVQPVLSGHRVTLTYNLYDTKGTGLFYPADFRPSPISGYIQTLVNNPDFLPSGGTLGLYSTHSYAHSRDEVIPCLPRNLKGIDMAMYQIFTLMQFTVKLRPIYYGNESRILNSENRRFEGRRHPITVGRALRPVETVDAQIEEYNSHEELGLYIPNDVRTSIVWLNTPKYCELAMTYIAYGNEAKMGAEYSALALLIPIPPFSPITQTRLPATLWRDRSRSPSVERGSDDELDDEDMKFGGLGGGFDKDEDAEVDQSLTAVKAWTGEGVRSMSPGMSIKLEP